MEAGSDRGITTIERAIAVGVFALLAAVAFPSLHRSRVASNETFAITSLRAIVSAELLYLTHCGNGGYAPTFGALLDALDEDAALPILKRDDGSIALEQNGYTLALVASVGSRYGPTDCRGQPTVTSYVATAVPTTLGWTGRRSFAVAADGVVWEIEAATPPPEPFGPPSKPLARR